MTDTNALAVLVRYHETGGLEGDCSDITLAMAKAELTALHATDEHPSAEDYRNRAERAEQALAERDAEVALLKVVAWNWLSYDQLLRQYSGPMERLGAGDWDLADTTYDKCVKATVAALGDNDAVKTGDEK